MPIMGMGGSIVGTDCRDFYDFCIREPRVSTDHQIILAELKGVGISRNHNH